MDFALTPEQEALRDTARAYLTGPASGNWAAIERLGWLDPELGTVELALLAEEAGHARMSGPWWATVALAAPALRAAGRPLPGPATLAAGPPCELSADGTVSGRKTLVPQADPDVSLVVTAGGELRLVGPVVPDAVEAPLDLTRPYGDVTLPGVPSEPLVDAAGTPAVLALTRRRTNAFLAAEAVGVATRALSYAREYAGIRTQFGRPIGAYQAVAHPLVDAYARIELARSLAYRAAWAVDAEPEHVADRAVAAAGIAASEAATYACEVAVQTLGGTGFTWEHPLHLWYRRAWWIATYGGGVAGLRARLAASLLDGPVRSR